MKRPQQHAFHQVAVTAHACLACLASPLGHHFSTILTTLPLKFVNANLGRRTTVLPATAYFAFNYKCNIHFLRRIRSDFTKVCFGEEICNFCLPRLTRRSYKLRIKIAREIISKSLNCWFQKLRVNPQLVEAFSLARNFANGPSTTCRGITLEVGLNKQNLIFYLKWKM